VHAGELCVQDIRRAGRGSDDALRATQSAVAHDVADDRVDACRARRVAAKSAARGPGEPVDAAAPGPRGARPGDRQGDRGGIDDFAFRRGHVYGTIVIDINTHDPLDVLADRTADTVAVWLKQHPGVQVVCRDRAGAYVEAARTGAPDAVQVADRWHLWHNLCEAVDKTVAAHRADLRPEPAGRDDEQAHDERVAERAAPQTDAPEVDGRLVTRTRERYAAVQTLHERGRSITAISRELGLDRRTSRRFVRAEHVEDLLVDGTLSRQPARCVQAVPARAVQHRTHRRRRADHADHRAGLPGQRQDRAPLPATLPRQPDRARTGAGRTQYPAGHRLADPPTPTAWTRTNACNARPSSPAARRSPQRPDM
jgi:Transposase